MNTQQIRTLTCTPWDAEVLRAIQPDNAIGLAVWWYDPKGIREDSQQHRRAAAFMRCHSIHESALRSGMPVTVHTDIDTGACTITAYIPGEPVMDGSKTTRRLHEVTKPLRTRLPDCGHRPPHQKPPGAWNLMMARFRNHPDMITDEYVWEFARNLVAHTSADATPGPDVARPTSPLHARG